MLCTQIATLICFSQHSIDGARMPGDPTPSGQRPCCTGFWLLQKDSAPLHCMGGRGTSLQGAETMPCVRGDIPQQGLGLRASIVFRLTQDSPWESTCRAPSSRDRIPLRCIQPHEDLQDLVRGSLIGKGSLILCRVGPRHYRLKTQ